MTSNINCIHKHQWVEVEARLSTKLITIVLCQIIEPIKKQLLNSENKFRNSIEQLFR